MPSPIDRYLQEIARELRGQPALSRRVVKEIADHLADSAAASRSRGMSSTDAEAAAVEKFGPAALVASRYARADVPLRSLLMLASLGTAAIAAWLLFVSFVVLPSRDPAHVILWRSIAIGFITYSATSGAFVLVSAWRRELRWALLLLSTGVVGFSAYALSRVVTVAGPEGHFEGYLLIMAIALLGHGLLALSSALLSIRTRALTAD